MYLLCAHSHAIYLYKRDFLLKFLKFVSRTAEAGENPIQDIAKVNKIYVEYLVSERYVQSPKQHLQIDFLVTVVKFG